MMGRREDPPGQDLKTRTQKLGRPLILREGLVLVGTAASMYCQRVLGALSLCKQIPLSRTSV